VAVVTRITKLNPETATWIAWCDWFVPASVLLGCTVKSELGRSALAWNIKKHCSFADAREPERDSPRCSRASVIQAQVIERRPRPVDRVSVVVPERGAAAGVIGNCEWYGVCSARNQIPNESELPLELTERSTLPQRPLLG